MSNNVYTESFFSNNSVSAAEKTGLMALILGGTKEKTALSYNGQENSFVSLVCDRRENKKTAVIFTYGHPETLSAMACKSLMHSMGVDQALKKKTSALDQTMDQKGVKYGAW